MRGSFFSIRESKNILLWHIREMQTCRLSFTPIEKLPLCNWDYFGHLIISLLVKFLDESKALKRIPEEKFFIEKNFKNESQINPMDSHEIRRKIYREIYRDFWFYRSNVIIDDIIAFAQYNMILLHNSWAEDITNNISVFEFLKKDFTMARLFKILLDIEDIDEEKIIKIPCCEYKIKTKVTRRVR